MRIDQDTLDELTAEFSDNAEDDEGRERSLRKRFEKSQEWEEHKRFHNAQGTVAHLIIWETEVPSSPSPNIIEQHAEETTHRRTIKVGGCDCQPKLPFMELKDDGKIISSAPVPEAATPVYGLTDNESPAVYGAAREPAANVYRSSSGGTKELYR